MWRMRTVELIWASFSASCAFSALRARSSRTTVSVCNDFCTTAKLRETRPTASTVRQITKMTKTRVRRARCAARGRAPAAPVGAGPLPRAAPVRLPPPALLEFDGDAQFGRLAARIDFGLARPGCHRPAGQDAQRRLVPAHTQRQARRADAARGVALEELLDHAVFQRMETHRRQAAAGAQHAVGLVETAGQRLQLIVDDDAQRLEDAARRVTGAETGGGRDVALDDLHQLARSGERLLLTHLHDAASDALGVPLLSVAKEDVGQLVLRQGVDQI